MKLALIPPFCHLEDTAKTDYQLMLPHLVSHPEYEKQYMHLCSDPRQFVILDNGVAEGKKIPFREILDIGIRFGVDEIVLPDVMGDAVRTMNAASQAIYQQGVHYAARYMFVLQGQTYDEVFMTAKYALSFSNVWSLGIPRHLIETIGDPKARWRIVEMLTSHLDVYGAGSRGIHLLGMNPTCPREMEDVPDWLKAKVRGFDTSAPYNFAYWGHSMMDKVSMKRPKKYFEQPAVEFSPLLVQDNIAYLAECAG